MMAQAKQQQKQSPDGYAQRGKALASSVQRLRGWVGSDPSRLPELADALVELTAHRLLGHAYDAAAADAQEAVRHAAQLLSATGPIGPYTSVTDAVRVVTAVVQLAAVQAGLGLPDSAGRTVESLQDMQSSLVELRMEEQLKPQTVIWALTCSARAALAAGDVSTSNAYADAALARLTESDLRGDADSGYLPVDVDRLLSDCRWGAGRAVEALSWLHSAKDRYDALVAGRLREPGRLSPGLLERLAEPLFGLYRDLSDRLAATGEADLGLVTRRELVDVLSGLTKRLGDACQVQLASALADLASDLLAVGRDAEAEEASASAAALVLEGSAARSHPEVAAVRARTLSRLGRSGEAAALLRSVLPEPPGSVSPGQAVALLALAEAQSAEGGDAAATTEVAFAAAAGDLLGPAVDETAARSLLADLARGVVSRGPGSLTWEPLNEHASYAATTAALVVARASQPGTADAQLERETAAWLEKERAEAHRRELERVEQARAEAERRVAERASAERAEAERRAAARLEAERAQRLEAERQAAAEEAERLAVKVRREERLEAHRLEVERQEAERREAERLEDERQTAALLAANPAEAERVELARIQAELAELERQEERARVGQQDAEREELERVEADRIEAERAEAARVEAARAEAERLDAAREEAEPADTEQVEAARVVTEPVDAAPVPTDLEPEEPDEVERALQEWREAQASGDRRAARSANEKVVELLRPQVEADPAQYGSQLIAALEQLSSARLRSGDLWGSRSLAREAKALARGRGPTSPS